MGHSCQHLSGGNDPGNIPASRKHRTTSKHPLLIVDGSHPAASLVSGNLTTLSGDTVSVVVSDMAISFNNAFVIERDWMFDNGIVHVIDRVLLPPSDPLPAK